jgi:hypothetical protein
MPNCRRLQRGAQFRLGGEATIAAKEAERWITDLKFASYLNEAVMPALRAASDDQQRGVLNRKQELLPPYPRMTVS